MGPVGPFYHHFSNVGEVKYKAESSDENLKAVSAFDLPEPLILWAEGWEPGQAAVSTSSVRKWM